MATIKISKKNNASIWVEVTAFVSEKSDFHMKNSSDLASGSEVAILDQDYATDPIAVAGSSCLSGIGYARRKLLNENIQIEVTRVRGRLFGKNMEGFSLAAELALLHSREKRDDAMTADMGDWQIV